MERIPLFRRIRGLKAAIAVSAIAVIAAAGTALAVRAPGPRASARSVAAVQQISLQPSSPSAPPSSASPKPSAKPSPKVTVSTSSLAGADGDHAARGAPGPGGVRHLALVEATAQTQAQAQAVA